MEPPKPIKLTNNEVFERLTQICTVWNKHCKHESIYNTDTLKEKLIKGAQLLTDILNKHG